MTESSPFVSICIPAYDRPSTLIELLNSVDESLTKDIEVVICEDKSPSRDIIRESINNFKKNSSLKIFYYENEQNLGYDSNLRELIKKSSGEYIIFMGDDDSFIKENLKIFIGFLKSNKRLGYILKSYIQIYENRMKENFNYFGETIFFPKGIDSYKLLFRRSVLISGFCFKRKYSLPFLISDFDGTLLFQLYLLAEICINHPSAYFHTPLTVISKHKRHKPMFGSSNNEKAFYTPGDITIENSINFMKGFFKISGYIDSKYNAKSTAFLRTEISKYSYPILAVQRKNGIKNFIRYNKILRKEIGINSTIYYYLYFIALIILGENVCDFIIIGFKKILGKTPRL